MSGDIPEMPGPQDPALDHLFRVLTVDGSADELAHRDAALAMFRDSGRRSRHRRPRFVPSMSMAAAAVVIIGGIAGAAYSAALPAPVQHIAYQLLDRIGVPDAHRPAPSSNVRGGGPAPSAGPVSALPASRVPASAQAGSPPAASASCPCQASEPAAGDAQSVLLSAAQTQIPSNGDDVFSGQLTRGGQPEAGVLLQLSEHVDGRSGWRLAGSETTDRSGEVTLTVRNLTSNASFRLAGSQATPSAAVPVTVIPPVSLQQAPGLLAGTRTLIAAAGFANIGDVIVLQEWSGASWYTIREKVLNTDHLASFTVRTPLSVDRDYRVVILPTVEHGTSVSGQVQIAPRLARSSA
jgi:hypothetical protein